MALDIGTLVGYLDLDKSAFKRKLDDTEPEARQSGSKAGKAYGDGFSRDASGRLRDEMGKFVADGEDAGHKSGKRFTGGFGKGLEGLSSVASKVMSTVASQLQVSATTLATGFSLQFVGSVAAGLASGAVKLAHGFGAIVALLPAAALAAGLALGTFKVALSGVGDALKAGLSGDTEAFDAALKGLSPSAQAVAREVAGLKGPLDDLKHTVQDTFFAPLVGQVRPLAAVYLPMLRDVMSGIAGDAGQAGSSIAAWARTSGVTTQVNGALANMRDALGNVINAGALLPAVFLPLVTVGASFLPSLTDGLAANVQQLRLFMEEAARTGQLRDFIQGGIDSLRSLWETGGQVWRILQNVFAIFQDFGGLGGIFSGLGIHTGGLLDSLEQLTEKARAFFETSEGGQAMAQAVRTVRQLLNASMGLFAHIAVILAPFLPQIAEFATAVENGMTAIVDAARPAIEMFLRDLLPAITDVVTFITSNTPLLQGILIGLFTAWAVHAGIAAAATLLASLPLILIGVAVAALAALFIIHFDTIKSVVMTVFNWIQDNWRTLLVILTGPIGLAVVFIVDHWNTIWGIIQTVYHWIVDNWQLVLGILIGPIAAAVMVIVAHWDTIWGKIQTVKQWIVDNWQELLGILTGPFGLAVSVISGHMDAIKEKVRSVFDWVSGKIDSLQSKLSGLTGATGALSGGGKSSGLFGIGGGLLGFDTGGVVPGQGPVPAIVHGGEWVLNRAQQDSLRYALRHGRAPGGATPAAGSTQVVVRIDPAGLPGPLLDWLQHAVRVDYGGDVIAALGA